MHDNILERLIGELEQSSDYQRRRTEIMRRNDTSKIVKHGIALVPVKFGISFSKTAMNQAGALLTVYRDGSVHFNHGGTEMGQGIHTKIAQILADELGIDLGPHPGDRHGDRQDSQCLPHRRFTGHRSQWHGGSRCRPADPERLTAFAATAYGVAEDQVRFERDIVRVGAETDVLARAGAPGLFGQGAVARRRILQDAAYHLGSPGRPRQPVLYFTYGASCSEVAVDTLTGEYVVLRTDILQDVGHSINPDIDLGQIEGGFLQGMGWLTTEELWWDDSGSAADPRAIHLQDPGGLRPAADLQRQPCRLVGQQRPDGAPLQGGGRAADNAGDVGVQRPRHGRGQRRRVSGGAAP